MEPFFSACIVTDELAIKQLYSQMLQNLLAHCAECIENKNAVPAARICFSAVLIDMILEKTMVVDSEDRTSHEMQGNQAEANAD